MFQGSNLKKLLKRHDLAAVVPTYSIAKLATDSGSIAFIKSNAAFPASPQTLNDPLRIVIIVATKGRPRAVTELLRFLEAQTLPPSAILVSATSTQDIESAYASSLPVEYMFGPAGSSCQRNRALDKLDDGFDLVVFFDDDFAPSSTWLEKCAEFFLARADVVGISGALIKDGVKSDEITSDEAQRLLRDSPPLTPQDCAFSDSVDLYGCNMAFRWAAVRELRFDENLVLYGWMEDKDYSRLAGRNGRLVIDNSLVGVHRGIRSGRVSGKRYGYSQVVNPWYLHRKGTMTAGEAWSNIVKALVVNGSKAIWPEKHIDRLGRLRGNLIGASLLLRGTCSPEKAAEL
jgi:GT2 family glycosyltransferase